MTPSRSTYAGVFLVALANVMYELLLTRIFSVTMWYHFAFMAISMAMLGLSAGALAVFLFPAYFPPEKTGQQLAWTALLFGLSMVLALAMHLNVSTASGESLPDPVSFIGSFATVAVPFVLGGMCMTLALTRFSRQVGAIYAADLIGAALGCVLLWVGLRLTDGPTAVVAAACLAGAAATCFALDGGGKKLIFGTAVSMLVLMCFCTVQARSALLRVSYVKGRVETEPLYEKWNSFSRITVHGDPNLAGQPVGWGFSPGAALTKVRQLHLLIDATAGTVLTGFDGDRAKLAYLKRDVTNVAHYLRPKSKVLIIGTGGGRDILSALAFNQPEVLGVDVNENIIETVNRRFGDFTGHLDRLPGVSFVNDDARSYLERSRDLFDIIQISVIDTWAATSAGAFALTENALYTLEGWSLFLQRLRPGGILSVSRFYSDDFPGETYRMAALASAALQQQGVVETRRHIAIVQRPGGESWGGPYGVATLLLSRSELSPEDLDELERRVAELSFQLLLSPRSAQSELLAKLANSSSSAAAISMLPIDVSPPTDNRPFFFQMARLRDTLRPAAATVQRREINNTAVSFLSLSFAAVGLMTALFILLPLLVRARNASFRGAGRPVLFFASIGFGFMLVEVSQLQRLNIFLGHPAYGLSAVLFSLLLFSGIGSWATKYLESKSGWSMQTVLVVLLLVLVLFGLVASQIWQACRASMTPVRILVAVVCLAPIGLVMGTAFPIGMRWASRDHQSLTPWLWGINGACSVCGSVLAVIIAMGAGISISFWTGLACYGVAAASLRGAFAPAAAAEMA